MLGFKTRFLIFWGLTFAGVHSFANCLDQVALNEKWNAISADQYSCLIKSQDFQSALNDICSQNKSTISGKYDAYLKFQDEYLKAMDELKNATTPVSHLQATYDLQQASTDWDVSGYKNEIESDLYNLNPQDNDCPADGK